MSGRGRGRDATLPAWLVQGNAAGLRPPGPPRPPEPPRPPGPPRGPAAPGTPHQSAVHPPPPAERPTQQHLSDQGAAHPGQATPQQQVPTHRYASDVTMDVEQHSDGVHSTYLAVPLPLVTKTIAHQPHHQFAPEVEMELEEAANRNVLQQQEEDMHRTLIQSRCAAAANPVVVRPWHSLHTTVLHML